MIVTNRTAKISISAFHMSDLDGSDISNPNVHSGYSPQLTEQIVANGSTARRTSTLQLTAESLRDLAEFGEAMEIGWADSGNTAGARSWRRLIDKCHKLARELEAPDA